MKNFSVFEKLDRNIAIIGLLVCIFLIPALYYFYQIRGLLLFVSIAFSLFIYLVVYKKILVSRVSLLPLKRFSIKTTLVINIIYYLSISIIFFSYVSRENIYQRPLVHFIAVAFTASLLAVEAFYCPKIKGYEYYVLLKIIFFGLLIRWLQLDLFPGHYWFDAWSHEKIVEDMLLTSRISEILPIYSKLPGMHLLYGTTMLVTGLSFKSSHMFLVVVAQVVVYSLVSYLIVARFISGKRVALVSALFVSIADTIILNSLLERPNGFVLIIGIVIIYGVILARYLSTKRINLLVYLLMFVSIITHTAGSFGIALILGCFWVAATFYKKVYGLRGKTIELSKGLIFSLSIFSISMLSWWMYASGHFTYLVKVVRWAFDMDKFIIAFTPEKGEIYSSSIPMSELFLNQIGFSMYLFFSIIGALYFFSKKSIGKLQGFSLALGGLVISAIGLVGLAIQAFILSDRWLYLSQIILAVPAAFGLIIFMRLFIKTRWFVIMVVFGSMVFFIITSTLVNFDNPILAPSKSLRNVLTKSEITSMQTIEDRWDGVIASDRLVFSFFRLRRSRILIFNEQLDTGNLTPLKHTLVLVRQYITLYPFYAGGVAWKLDFDLIELLEQQRYIQIYDSGEVKVFQYFADE